MKRLTGDEWATHQQATPPESWTTPLYKETKEGWRCLELGVGTGVQSARLAEQGRQVAGVDSSEDIIRRLRYSPRGEAFISLRVADVMQKFPYKDKSFDCVWSSGLLEHFVPEELDHIMAESIKIAKKKVISFVPNAKCKAYMDWKADKEARGTWEYGLEIPRETMKPFFKGLKNVREYSVGDTFVTGNEKYLLVTVGEV